MRSRQPVEASRGRSVTPTASRRHGQRSLPRRPVSFGWRGFRDPATVGRLVKALGAPININVRAGSPSVAELEALGVARASTASQLALMAMSMTRQVADELRATGRFDTLSPAMAQADAQRLFTGLP